MNSISNFKLDIDGCFEFLLFSLRFLGAANNPLRFCFFEGAVGAQPNPLTSQAFGRRQDAPAVHGQVSAAEFEAAEARLAQRRGAAGAAGAPP